MSKRDIGQEILDGVREIKAYKAGRKKLRDRNLLQVICAKLKRVKIKQKS
jgi:hypothetical protein